MFSQFTNAITNAINAINDLLNINTNTNAIIQKNIAEMIEKRERMKRKQEQRKQMYKIEHFGPTRELSKKTHCSLKTLKKIVNKGKGAYFSSGSRPNQTPESWGIARLASSVTGGKASMVDFKLLEEGCAKDSPALKLARRNRHSIRRTRKFVK